MHCSVKSWQDKLIHRLIGQVAFQVNRQEIPILHLPAAFDGLTVVQISDLHIDRWNTHLVEQAVDVVNALNADLVVCTGDTIADGPDYLGDVTHLLKQFKARHGKLACLGNHDYSDGSRSLGVRDALSKAGFDVLVNESTELTLHHQKIHLAGADDLLLGRQCLDSTTRRLGHERATILLSHNPENFDAMAHCRPDLVLSGHTHGGQVHLPFNLHRRLFRSPYIAGGYECMSSRLYVNRGLGSAVFVHHMNGQRIALPTPRWSVQPEVSVFTLVNPRLRNRVHHLQPEAMVG